MIKEKKLRKENIKIFYKQTNKQTNKQKELSTNCIRFNEMSNDHANPIFKFMCLWIL